MAKLSTEPLFFPGNKLGIKLDFPEQFLNKAISPYSRNIEYINGVFEGRGGLQKLDTTALPGQLQYMEQFWKFDGSNFLMCITTKDAAYYDFTNTRFVYLTPVYSTGTITIAGGAPTIVVGSGTAWNTELEAGDYFKIGTGSIHSDSTWYEIQTVTDATHITLTSAAPATGAGSGYVTRKILKGSSSGFVTATSFEDSILGELFIFTNGVDLPHRWGGTGQATPLATVPTAFTSCRFVGQFKDRLLLGWTVEGGGNQPQRIRASAVANCESYDDSLFWDFPEGQAWITGFCPFADYYVVMRERGCRVGRFVGGTEVFDWEVNTVPVGGNAGLSIIVAGDTIFYYGIDNKFHAFNILREESISDDILPFTKDFDPNKEAFIYGWHVEWKNQIRWFVPHASTDYHNACIVFDYSQNMLEIWEYQSAQACRCIAEYINTTDLYADDAVWGELYADEVEAYADDRSFLSAAPTLVYGGYDGYIRKADITIQDDGVDYDRVFDSRRLDFRMPDMDKRLWMQQFWFEAEPSGSVTISLKKGDNDLFETETKTISLVNAGKDKVKANVRWDKADRDFQVRISSTNHFSLFGFFNHFFPKGKTYA